MDRQGLIDHALARFGAEPEYLWRKYPGYFVLRRPDSGKWFALVMDVPRDRLGLAGGGSADVVDVKCGPALLGSCLGREGFLPAYHMSKTNWVSIRLDGAAPDADIAALLDISYDLAK